MATDYAARQSAKRSRRNSEQPKRVRKKKNQPRRLCRGQCFQAPLLDDNAIEVETKPSRKPNPVGELSKYANLTFDGPKRSAASSKYVAGNGDGAPEGGKKRRSREVDAPNAKEGAPAGKRVKLSTAVNLLTAGKRAAPASLQQSTKRSGTSSKGADPLQLLPEPLQQYMRSKGHAEALPIQAQCWAPLLAGSDVTAVAPPGSGKTLGYLLPAAAHVLRIGHSAATRPPGPLAVVLLPTRELAQQVAGVCQGLKRHCGLRSVCITGGVEKEEQIQALARGPHVVIATPGRLLDLEEEGHVILSDVECIILDEADKMLGLGFAPQIDKLKDLLLTSAAEAGRKRPQVALFTATMPQQVRAVADAWLRLPKRIIVAASGEGDKEGQGNGTGEQGGAGTISPTVVQVVQVCADHKKAAKLLKHMEAVKAAAAGQRHAPRVLIFANRIKRVRFIAKLLEREGYRTAELHGQRSQEERQEAIRAFKSGKAQVLVASDVAARGLDIKNLPYVVNYDFPSNVETYVHRVGRTGRLAADGHAFSFMTREVAPLAQPLLDLLQAHDQPVDPNLVKLAEAYAIAAKKLSIEPSSAAAAVSRAKPEGNEDEEDEEERVALRPATEDVLKELNLKTKAQKKRDKAAEKTREKKRKAREEVADHASSDDGGDSDEQPSGTAATARLPVGDAPHAEFLAAKRFAGAKPGYVFKRGGMGVGYYLDRPPHLAAKARALELKKAKAKASMKPIGGEAVGRAPTKVSAKAPVTKKPVPLLPGRMKQLKKARGDSSGESSEDEGGAHGAVARRKPLPGRLRKKLAREKAGAGRKGGAA